VFSGWVGGQEGGAGSEPWLSEPCIIAVLVPSPPPVALACFIISSLPPLSPQQTQGAPPFSSRPAPPLQRRRWESMRWDRGAFTLQARGSIYYSPQCRMFMLTRTSPTRDVTYAKWRRRHTPVKTHIDDVKYILTSALRQGPWHSIGRAQGLEMAGNRAGDVEGQHAGQEAKEGTRA
jgi:hypothetical protein